MPLQRRHTGGFDHAPFFRKTHWGESLLRYRKGTVIYPQGDVCDAVYFLQSGQVRLTVCSSTGREAIIGMLGPGDFLGAGCLVGQDTRVATATAVRDSTAIRVEKAAMGSLLRSDHEFSQAFLSYLLRRMVTIEAELVDQIFSSTSRRLARALLLMARAGNEQSLPAVIPRVTHETLAQMIGATRAQVSALMSQFRKKGYIHYDGNLRVNESLIDVVLQDERYASPACTSREPFP